MFQATSWVKIEIFKAMTEEKDEVLKHHGHQAASRVDEKCN
jgi:hypothetical protein